MSINQIRTVKSYQTTDNKLHDDLHSAYKHQAALDIRDQLDREPIYGQFEGCKTEATELLAWLDAYHDLVMQYIRPGT